MRFYTLEPRMTLTGVKEKIIRLRANSKNRLSTHVLGFSIWPAAHGQPVWNVCLKVCQTEPFLIVCGSLCTAPRHNQSLLSSYCAARFSCFANWQLADKNDCMFVTTSVMQTSKIMGWMIWPKNNLGDDLWFWPVCFLRDWLKFFRTSFAREVNRNYRTPVLVLAIPETLK